MHIFTRTQRKQENVLEFFFLSAYYAGCTCTYKAFGETWRVLSAWCMNIINLIISEIWVKKKYLHGVTKTLFFASKKIHYSVKKLRSVRPVDLFQVVDKSTMKDIIFMLNVVLTLMISVFYLKMSHIKWK